MVKRVEDIIVDNRRGLSRIDAGLVSISGQIPGGEDKALSFRSNVIDVTIETKIHKRNLNNSLISGHPDGNSYGSGTGESGDRRQSWSVVETLSGQNMVTDGRNEIAKALKGESNTKVTSIELGSDGTATKISDSALKSSFDSHRFFWSEDDTLDTTKVQGIFLFSDHGQTIKESGTFSSNNVMYQRETFDHTISLDEEVRMEITFEFAVDGVGNTTPTDKAKEKIADTIQPSTGTIGFNKILLGNGDPSPVDGTETSLANEIDAKNCQRLLNDEMVLGRISWFEDEPGSLPRDIKELGLEDNNGDLLWIADIQDFEKTSDFAFSVEVGFRIV